MKNKTSTLISTIAIILIFAMSAVFFVSCMKGLGTEIGDIFDIFDEETETSDETTNNPNSGNNTNKPNSGGSPNTGNGTNDSNTGNSGATTNKPNNDNIEDETDSPDTGNTNVETYTVKLSKGDIVYDSDLLSYVYREYAAYEYKGKLNEKYEIKMEDRSSEEYFCRSDMVLTGTYTTNRTYYVEYYEVDGDAFIYGTNKNTGTGYVELRSVDCNYSKCVILRNTADFAITSLTIKILDGFDVPIDEIVITDYVIPANGYIVLFPEHYEFLGYEGSNATYMTCSYNASFASFMADVYN